MTQESMLLIFYLSIFMVLISYRHLSAKTIVMHSIWFSQSGELPQDVLDNFLYLRKLLKSQKRKHRYDLYFWTDMTTLNQSDHTLLKQTKITVKDFRDYIPQSSVEIQALNWVESLVRMADKREVFYYAMAADVLRMCLLFGSGCSFSKANYSIYFDPNDIVFTKLPDPNRLCQIEYYAFHIASIRYKEVLLKLLGRKKERREFVTNDLIVVNHRVARAELASILEIYMNNLLHCCSEEVSVLDCLQEQTVEVGNTLSYLIVFSTTHLMNLFRFDYADDTILFLLKYNRKYCDKKRCYKLQNAAEFIDFERDYDKGATWISEDKDDDVRVSEWLNRFRVRYDLIKMSGLA